MCESYKIRENAKVPVNLLWNVFLDKLYRNFPAVKQSSLVDLRDRSAGNRFDTKLLEYLVNRTAEFLFDQLDRLYLAHVRRGILQRCQCTHPRFGDKIGPGSDDLTHFDKNG